MKALETDKGGFHFATPNQIKRVHMVELNTNWGTFFDCSIILLVSSFAAASNSPKASSASSEQYLLAFQNFLRQQLQAEQRNRLRGLLLPSSHTPSPVAAMVSHPASTQTLLPRSSAMGQAKPCVQAEPCSSSAGGFLLPRNLRLGACSMEKLNSCDPTCF